MAEQRRQQHLYLVFDDWQSGYSIRKVSLSRRSGKRSSDQWSNDSSGEEDSEQQPAAALSSGGSGKFFRGAKPLPVFMRVSAQRGYPDFFTSAFGTKIMAMHPVRDGDGVPAIDVQDHTITFEPLCNYPALSFYIPAGDDRLFHLDLSTFEVLQKPPEPSSGQPWEWRQLTAPPLGFPDSYCVLPDDGCSIFVSIKSSRTTFVFDTKEEVWRKYGDWTFPFTGFGYYDTSLKGFVGLSQNPETFGYLCCCTITTMASTATCLDFKCTKEKVYNKNPTEGQHVSATLVHMRPGRFCLVECVCIEDSGMTEQVVNQWDFMGGGPQGGRFVYRLKTFSVCYDTKGDHLKFKHCKVRCYSLPHEARIGSIRMDPVVFWL